MQATPPPASRRDDHAAGRSSGSHLSRAHVHRAAARRRPAAGAFERAVGRRAKRAVLGHHGCQRRRQGGWGGGVGLEPQRHGVVRIGCQLGGGGLPRPPRPPPQKGWLLEAVLRFLYLRQVQACSCVPRIWKRVTSIPPCTLPPLSPHRHPTPHKPHPHPHRHPTPPSRPRCWMCWPGMTTAAPWAARCWSTGGRAASRPSCASGAAGAGERAALPAARGPAAVGLARRPFRHQPAALPFRRTHPSCAPLPLWPLRPPARQLLRAAARRPHGSGHGARGHHHSGAAQAATRDASDREARARGRRAC